MEEHARNANGLGLLLFYAESQPPTWLGASPKLTLASGRDIELTELHQWRTYAGLLAGKPDSRMNRHVIEEVLARAKQWTLEGTPPMLLEPLPEERAGRLPDTACVGVFDSGKLDRPDSEPYSSVTLVWFQPAFALPIAARIEERIRNVDWDTVAKDWCW